jgi:hypothetical protein
MAIGRRRERDHDGGTVRAADGGRHRGAPQRGGTCRETQRELLIHRSVPDGTATPPGGGLLVTPGVKAVDEAVSAAAGQVVLGEAGAAELFVSPTDMTDERTGARD